MLPMWMPALVSRTRKDSAINHAEGLITLRGHDQEFGVAIASSTTFLGCMPTNSILSASRFAIASRPLLNAPSPTIFSLTEGRRRHAPPGSQTPFPR